ncbi:MAG: D-cysteine desulfhydrase family protein [Planctomycetes bacterium]|nr:D-cysteine desulfhydrase family protein [Planctomycetota bacterium]
MNEPPRIELARLPTPIDHLQDLSRELGVEIYVKRDDLTGAALTGNKVRKLEYVLAHALEVDADIVLTCGSAQSNHCRATAIAARRSGLDVELFLGGARDASVRGNLFLDLLMGAGIHHLSDEAFEEVDAHMAQRAEELGAQGRDAFVIPEGASTPLGALGYVRCMKEIRNEEDEADVSFDLLVVPVGSGGTLAGLLAGAQRYGFKGRIVGIPVCHDAEFFATKVTTLLEGMRRDHLDDLDPVVPIGTLVDGFVGEGYGHATFAELERIRDLAILTGIILDPVYTNKAFGALLSLVRTGALAPGQRALFLHTGGLFGLFPYGDQMPHLMVP